MKALGGYVAKGQACAQTGVGCTSLQSDIGSNGLSSTDKTKIAKNTAFDLILTNDKCKVTAKVDTVGVVTYEAAGVASADTQQCKDGAGLGS
jgi:type IV pilus assembly protein PilA